MNWFVKYLIDDVTGKDSVNRTHSEKQRYRLILIGLLAGLSLVWMPYSLILLAIVARKIWIMLKDK